MVTLVIILCKLYVTAFKSKPRSPGQSGKVKRNSLGNSKHLERLCKNKYKKKVGFEVAIF